MNTEAQVQPRPDPTAPSPRGRRVIPVALFSFVFLVHATSPNIEITDSIRAVPVAQSIAQRGTLSLDHFREAMPLPGHNVNVIGGHLYGNYPWANSLFAVPVLWVVDGAHALGLGPGVEGRIASVQSDWEFQVVTMSLVVAATAVVLYLIGLQALTVVDPSRRRRYALAAALVFAFGTAAWSTASRSYWQHGPSMLMLSLAALVAVRSRSDPRALRWLGPPLAASYFMRPTNVVPVVLFSAWVLIEHRRYLLHHLAGLAAVSAIFVTVNLSAYGSILQPYFTEPRHVRTGGELAESLAGNLISPGRGLLVFSPVLVLAVAGMVIRRRARQSDGLDLLLAACVVGHWLSISLLAYPAWWGGHSFGPRLFSDMVPFLIVLALPVLDRLADEDRPRPARRRAMAGCATLAAVSVLINFSGAYFRSSTCWSGGINEHPSRLWDVTDLQFLAGPYNFVRGDSQRLELTRGTVDGLVCPPESLEA